jgi:hypothetical protein
MTFLLADSKLFFSTLSTPIADLYGLSIHDLIYIYIHHDTNCRANLSIFVIYIYDAPRHVLLFLLYTLLLILFYCVLSISYIHAVISLDGHYRATKYYMFY